MDSPPRISVYWGSSFLSFRAESRVQFTHVISTEVWTPKAEKSLICKTTIIIYKNEAIPFHEKYTFSQNILRICLTWNYGCNTIDTEKFLVFSSMKIFLLNSARILLLFHLWNCGCWLLRNCLQFVPLCLAFRPWNRSLVSDWVCLPCTASSVSVAELISAPKTTWNTRCRSREGVRWRAMKKLDCQVPTDRDSQWHSWNIYSLVFVRKADPLNFSRFGFLICHSRDLLAGIQSFNVRVQLCHDWSI